MTTLKLTDSLSKNLCKILNQFPRFNTDERELDKIIEHYSILSESEINLLEKIGSICYKLLNENGFVHLKNIPLSEDARYITILGIILGEVFTDLKHQSSIVVKASPTIGDPLQGNQTKCLFLHTDFAMLDPCPELTIIECKKTDPLGKDFGNNGISLAQNIVSRYYGSELLEKFYNVKLPFAGSTPDGEIIIIESPILQETVNPKELTKVRFHPSRIHFGFRVLKRQPSQQETEVLREFQRVAKEVRIGIFLEAGDFLIINNRCALHDRDRCGLELNLDSLNSRITNILFVKEMKKYE